LAPIATSKFRTGRTRPLRRLHHHRERGRRLHLDRLRTRAADFDPAVRDRLIAGAMTPASLVVKAQKFRRWYRDQVLQAVRRGRRHPGAGDAVHRAADRAGHFDARRVELPVRANLGIYTQPISFIGLPVVAVPVPLDPLPIAVQIIAAPWREDVALRIAHTLETRRRDAR
jgi:1-carboxybiuret hydrolase